MSGQYPGNYNNPMAGHRNQFNPQQQQQQQQQQQIMNQMQMSSATSNATAGAGGSGVGVGMTTTGNILPMGYNQGNILSQQQQQSANPTQQQGMQSISGPSGNVMNSVGMQSQTHVQHQLIQQQLQMQQQQQQIGSVGSQMGMVTSSVTNTTQIGNIMQQQQPLMVQQQQQQQQSQQQQQAQLQTTQQNTLQSQVQGGSSTQQSQSQQQVSQISGQIGQTQQQQQPTNSMLSISQQPHKEINIVTLSRVGQETVQDITSRFQEIFAALKIIQPTAVRDNQTVKRVQEHFRTIRLLFKRMRLIYERCNDGYPQGMEFSTVETSIPYKDEPEHRIEASQCEEYRRALQENQELIDTVKLKNRQLREIIDRTRIIVWEINTMLSMRRS